MGDLEFPKQFEMKLSFEISTFFIKPIIRAALAFGGLM
jgi:hypothetical protein